MKSRVDEPEAEGPKNAAELLFSVPAESHEADFSQSLDDFFGRAPVPGDQAEGPASVASRDKLAELFRQTSAAEADSGAHPIPADDWIADLLMEAGLDGRMVDVSGGAAFLLCRRASRLSSHAAQWALPGGRVDPGETAVGAALRELEEEVGISLPESAVLGLLDDYPTRSGYVITPVVIWGGGRLNPRPAPDEVAAVYRVGLHQLQREDSPRFITIPESSRPVVQIPLGNDLIHAPTGAVLLQLRWLCLEGRDDAVDELEQPVFAWK